jgi:hypothetical protein
MCLSSPAGHGHDESHQETVLVSTLIRGVMNGHATEFLSLLQAYIFPGSVNSSQYTHTTV